MEKTIFDTSGQSVQKSQEGLFLQDGIAGLRALPRHSVDMLLTDPPYGTTRNFWDVPLSLPELWEAVKWAVKPEGAVLFFAQCPYHQAREMPTLKSLIWRETESKTQQICNSIPVAYLLRLIIATERYSRAAAPRCRDPGRGSRQFPAGGSQNSFSASLR